MTRKLLFTVSLLVLATVLTGASFADNISNQITFGPSTEGTITVGNSLVSLNGVSGLAYLGNTAGTFTLSDLSVSFGPHSPSEFPTGSPVFTVTIGSDTVTGWLSITEVVPINNMLIFFYGTDNITSSNFPGYGVGAAIPFDFTTRSGDISSGELVPTPEPGTIALVGSGLLAVAGLLRRKL